MLPYQNLITINPVSSKAQYQQIVDQIADCIKNGVMPSESKLPSSRQLATLLNIHRKTVIAAYEELIAQGWIVAKSRSGYYISSGLLVPEIWKANKRADLFPEKLPISISKKHATDRLAFLDYSVGASCSYIDDGLPDARIAPFADLLRAYKRATQRNYKLKKVNAGSMAEPVRLKEAIMLHLSKSRGFMPKVNNVFVTNGAQMAIYLVAQVLIDPGDVVIVGAPGYALADYNFRNFGANVVKVPVGDYGIDTQAVENICKRCKVKAIYLVPHHHYPTTATLSPQKRLKLITMASIYDYLIIEDDYDYDYHYALAPHLPMATYRHSGRVIYIGSLSKSFAPSLRLGFIVASADLIDTVGALRKNIDIRGDFLMEDAMASMFESGEMERHLKRSVKVYKERRDFFCDALNSTLSQFISFLKPSGGLALWLAVNKRFEVEEFSHRLIKQGICLSRRTIFGKSYGLNHFRLGFASLNLSEISKLVKAMEITFNSYDKPDEK